MSSKTPTYTQTVPLPDATLHALRRVYRARGLSRRRLASSIGTVHPHVGRIVAGTSRPSRILAERIGVALDLPPEFTALMMEQSSPLGRKMRFPDGFGDVDGPIGETPCPVEAAACNEDMYRALVVAGWGDLAREFAAREAIQAVGLAPAMGSALVVTGGALDPWGEFKEAGGVGPLLAWRGDPKPPYALSVADLGEFIAGVPADRVIRCVCHDRR